MKTIKETLLYVLLIAIIIILITDRCNSEKDYTEELARMEHNIKASNDSIIKYYSNEQEISSKLAFKYTLDELNSNNEGLSKEVEKLKGEVQNMTSTTITYNYSDTIYSHTTDTFMFDASSSIDSILTFPVIRETEYNKIVGSYKISLTNRDELLKLDAIGLFLDTVQFKANLVLGFEELNDELRVFAYSKNPYVKFDELESVMIIPKNHLKQKKKHFNRLGLGLNLGYGVGYDLTARQFYHGVQFSIGLNYNIFVF